MRKIIQTGLSVLLITSQLSLLQHSPNRRVENRDGLHHQWGQDTCFWCNLGLLSSFCIPQNQLRKIHSHLQVTWSGEGAAVSLLHISKFQLTARIQNQKLNFTCAFQSLTWLFHMCNDPVESHFSTQVACIVHSFPTRFQRKTHLCQLHNRRLINI